jgi:hypothetical protein
MKACRRPDQRAYSLVELTVAMFLLGLIFYAVGAFFSSALTHHRQTMAALEVQEDALSTVGRLTTLFSESHRTTVKPALTAAGPVVAEAGNPLGLIFASPRDASGRLSIDATSGEPVWQRWLAVYHDPLTERIYECVETIGGALTSIPPVPDPDHDILWYRGNTSAPRPMPGRISDLDMEVQPSLQTVLLKVRVEHPDLPGNSLELTSRGSFRD